MESQYCLSCMNPVPTEAQVCPYCGCRIHSAPSSPNVLKPGIILNGKYLVGRTLGQGGFGITYIGLDLVLREKVAIKEYYPSCTGLVKRHNGSAVIWNGELANETGLEISMSSFLKEARKMAKMASNPAIVSVKNLFSENNTSYIVMDYVEGETLANALMTNGIMRFSDCIRLLAPIITAMAEMHTSGIVHRDISPDNIMLKPDGGLVLLDLGAAKEIDMLQKDGTTQSSQLIHKNGFSPPEQYNPSGKIGTWTDIYAICATIYYCCTGVIPPMASERMISAEISHHPNLSAQEYSVLMDGMQLDYRKRIPNMLELLDRLLNVAANPKTTDVPVLHSTAQQLSTLNNSKISFATFTEHPLRLAGLILGIETAAYMFLSFATSALSLAAFLRIGGHLLILYAIMQVPISKKLIALSAFLLGISYLSMGMMSTYAAAISMVSTSILLITSSGSKGNQNWLSMYWYWIFVLFAAYIAMLCIESFSAIEISLDVLFGLSLFLLVKKIASVHIF